MFGIMHGAEFQHFKYFFFESHPFLHKNGLPLESIMIRSDDGQKWEKEYGQYGGAYGHIECLGFIQNLAPCRLSGLR